MMVRALTFRKRFAQVKHQSTWWAMLGHADEMECSTQLNMSLEEISKHNDKLYKMDSDKAYHHVVYLIDTNFVIKGQATDASIWTPGKDFLSITRIHFPNAIDLHDQFTKLNSFFSELSSKPEYKGISWRTYYTMELSDMVLISKSNQFHTLSRWSLLATKTWLVGNAYTYFCISGALLEGTPKKWPNYIYNDYVDFLSIRFSVQGSGADEELLKTQKCLGYKYASPPFRVAGNEDAIICAQHVPTQNLLKLYRSWYQDRSKVLLIFRDIITRIGTDWQYIPPDAKDLGDIPPETALEKHSKRVLQKISSLDLSDYKTLLQERVWLRPLVELTNALVHMSHSATLDEPVFLILPAINAFWDNVLDDPRRLEDDPLYLRFAELCIHTLEHLMRGEGQLTHRPEMRPLAFDLPVFMLEYATTFLLAFCGTLSIPDGDGADRICFLLVPSAETEVATEEPFEGKGNRPGLLQTTIPFSFLYNPQHLLPTLCHEMAHYIGETLRKRNDRYWAFLNSTAVVLIDYFFDSISGDVGKFHDFIVKEYLDKSIRTSVEEKPCDGETDIVKLPLQKIYDMIAELIYGTFSDKNYDAYAELVRNYVLSKYCGAQIHSYSREHIASQCYSFMVRINDLRLSFRETYADICMLYCLELAPESYLDVAVHKWEGINSSTLLRVYASLSISGHSMKEILSAVDSWGRKQSVSSDERNSACKEIMDLDEWISEEECCAEQYLMDYLLCCWEGFKAQKIDTCVILDNEEYTPKKIYETIKGIDSGTKYQDILEIIDSGRKSVLKQL